MGWWSKQLKHYSKTYCKISIAHHCKSIYVLGTSLIESGSIWTSRKSRWARARAYADAGQPPPTITLEGKFNHLIYHPFSCTFKTLFVISIHKCFQVPASRLYLRCAVGSNTCLGSSCFTNTTFLNSKYVYVAWLQLTH